MKKISIATRGSNLALWQANHVKSLLLSAYPQLEIELQVIKTQGDKILDVALAKVGGKGLFVKEIEEALLNHEADLAVHSLKDVPMILPKELKIGAYLERENPFDLFLSETATSFNDLPKNAVLGTSSLRRQAQALFLRPDLDIQLLRGNVETRLNKMKSGQYTAIILANAGVERLGLSTKYKEILKPPFFLPAVGQGALALETRKDDKEIQQLINFLNHRETALCVETERAFMRTLEGGCQVPIAAYATIKNNKICLKGRISETDGKNRVEDEINSNTPDCGITLALNMLVKGGKAILDKLLN